MRCPCPSTKLIRLVLRAERPCTFDVVLHRRAHIHESMFDFSRHISILSRNLKHHPKNSQAQALGPPYQGSPSTHHLLLDCTSSKQFHSKASEHSNREQILVGVPIFHIETQQSSQSLVTDPISNNRHEISCASFSSMSTQSLRQASTT